MSSSDVVQTTRSVTRSNAPSASTVYATNPYPANVPRGTLPLGAEYATYNATGFALVGRVGYDALQLAIATPASSTNAVRDIVIFDMRYRKQLDGVASASRRTLVRRRSPRSAPEVPRQFSSNVTQNFLISCDAGASSISLTVNLPAALH